MSNLVHAGSFETMQMRGMIRVSSKGFSGELHPELLIEFSPGSAPPRELSISSHRIPVTVCLTPVVVSELAGVGRLLDSAVGNLDAFEVAVRPDAMESRGDKYG